MKINSNYFPIVISAAIAFGILLGGWLNFPGQEHFLVKNVSKNKLNRLLDFINNEYVDSVNSDSIMKHAIDNVLGQLDPHSVYIPASEQEQVAESMRGDFVGIGVN
nr:peptidase S41 [Flavobacterium sp.]